MDNLAQQVDFTTAFWQDKRILIDSRKLVWANQSIFFALEGKLTDGHAFIPVLYEQGVRCFVVQQAVVFSDYPAANFVVVEDVLDLLQAFAAFHRAQFLIPVLGITGSNGKTIIKEWLSLLLEEDFNLVKSPKSYNSQLGVPLSVLGMNKQHELAIFEAGISQVGEMQRLQKMIQPTVGIFTNIGEAHASGFETETQKITEKLSLFLTAKVLIYRIEQSLVHQLIQQQYPQLETWSWGASPKAKIPIYIHQKKSFAAIEIHWKGKVEQLEIPFANAAALENCLHCIVTLLYLDYSVKQIKKGLPKLRDVPMRLELKQGINNCHIIDDSYNNDLEGLKIALDFLEQKHQNNPLFKKTLILSDMPEAKAENYHLIAQLIEDNHIQKLVAIGPALKQHQLLFKFIPELYFFENTSDFIAKIGTKILFQQEQILLKGARFFEFERIAQQLKNRVHGTVLEINLGAILNNFKVYKNSLKPSTKMMVMVKASAYGNGSYEIAQLLQYNRVDYLGVAYVDEGIALRQRGIQVPIMVMNTAAPELEVLCHYQLEPVLYSFGMLEQFVQYLETAKLRDYPVHLELDSGMHRLGFLPKDIDQLIERLKELKGQLFIKGIFSHLAASDEPVFESFTYQQIQLFESLTKQIEQALEIKSIKHILNSAGISAYPQYQLDMVRLGIGLYGIDPNQQLKKLQNTVQLKTTVAQIKTLEQTETVGYSRKGKLSKETKIAIISIGYADGFLRAFGNGKALVKIRNKWLPTVGNICMDMCFIDVSSLSDIQEGDEVIIFDSVQSINELAQNIGTISYEILTNISDRVPRVFYEE